MAFEAVLAVALLPSPFLHHVVTLKHVLIEIVVMTDHSSAFANVIKPLQEEALQEEVKEQLRLLFA